MDKQKKKAEKILKNQGSVHLAILDDTAEISEKIDAVKEQIKEEVIDFKGEGTVLIRGKQGEKGEKGDKGDKGEQGERGEKGEDGRDGIDGRDGKDGINGIDGMDGKDGKDGKDGSSDTPEQVIQKIYQAEALIPVERIEGYKNYDDEIATLQNRTQLLLQISTQRTNSSSSDGTVGPGTTNEIAYFDSEDTVASLDTATYPSLAELAYVKGVTSAIQTQLDGKQATISGLTASGAELNILDGATLSTTELNYVDGVTSSIQTQLGTKATIVGSDKYVFFNDGGSTMGGVIDFQFDKATATVQVGANSGSSGIIEVVQSDGTVRAKITGDAAGGSFFNSGLGIGLSTPSTDGFLHISGGTTSKVPLLINSGSLKTVAVSGGIEYNGTNLFYTDSNPTRRTLVTTDNTQTLTNKTLSAMTLSGVATMEEDSEIMLDTALSADGKYCGITETGTAGTALAFGDLVYLAAADSRWELADADADATSGAVKLGMCVLAAAGDGSATKILLYGKIRADAAFPSLTISAPVYVGTTAGDIQTAQPSGTDDVIRIIGYGNTADELFFCPSNDYITHT